MKEGLVALVFIGAFLWFTNKFIPFYPLLRMDFYIDVDESPAGFGSWQCELTEETRIGRIANTLSESYVCF